MSFDTDNVMEKWEKVIVRLSELISAEGKKIVVFNVEAGPDPNRQYRNYLATCETVKSIFEAVVTSSFPGEERIFWPYKDTQFYIRKGEDNVHVTGDYEVFKRVLE